MEKMENNTYSLDEIIREVEAKGVAVFDITRMPVYNEPVTAPYVIIALNHSGWIRSEFDFEMDLFGKHDFTLLSPGHVMVPLETSEDYSPPLLRYSGRDVSRQLQVHTLLSDYLPSYR